MQQIYDDGLIKKNEAGSFEVVNDPAEQEVIKAKRKLRIAAGSGVSVQEVNKLLKQFEEMQKMMKMFSKGGIGKMMRGFSGRFPGM